MFRRGMKRKKKIVGLMSVPVERDVIARSGMPSARTLLKNTATKTIATPIPRISEAKTDVTNSEISIMGLLKLLTMKSPPC